MMTTNKNNIQQKPALLSAKIQLQSPHLYLQAAGSTGVDSTKGIHLRWLLKNALNKHLPKGDHYNGAPEGFNKPNDYVTIFRVPYRPVPISLNFAQPPQAVDDSQSLWLYNISGKIFYVYFRNTVRYLQVRASIDPLLNSTGFLIAYGNNLIEVENKDSLFFAVTPYTNTISGHFKTEILSVEYNEFNMPKYTSFRKSLLGALTIPKIITENGRSIRFVPNGGQIIQLDFEFYEDVYKTFEHDDSRIKLGNFGLTLKDEIAYQRLDPRPDTNPVHAKWFRYNGGEYVNIENYQNKWNGHFEDPRRRIKDSVERYLDLSSDPMNPMANEIYYLNDIDEGPGSGLEISNLLMLQMASMDYHVARMLGLGALDLEERIFKGQYIYVAEYVTLGSLNGDGEIGQEMKHVYLSLPTSLEDQRLSLPVDLKEPVPGVATASTQVGNNAVITDSNGYAHDGKSRYLSLFTEELTPEEPENSPFYFSAQEFEMSDFTYPVYVGIEYKNQGESQWKKPELPNDPQYQNVDEYGSTSRNETIGIAIPDVGAPAYIHRETNSGKHLYGSYGVNWFSRATSSNKIWEVESEIKASNDLLPPSNINALLIQEESPLFLTSNNEQTLLAAISNTDKTFVRLTFEYDTVQDMISYHKAINGQVMPDFNPPLVANEIFADEIEIFFSPEIPEQLFGVINSISDLSGNPFVSVIQSAPLILASAGTTLYPTIPSAEIPQYIGGILKVGADEYLIHDIIIPSATPDLPIFHILKKQISNAFSNSNNMPYDPADFITPDDGQTFMLVKNMQNVISWGMTNPHPMKVTVGNNWPVHTEEVTIASGDGNDITYNTYFRRFRGFLNNNATVKKYTDVFSPVFSGLYEIKLAGYTLGNHPQFNPNSEQISVQWYRGSIRIPYEDNPGGELKILKVLRFQQEPDNLLIYAQDENYQSDPLQNVAIRSAVKVNFYPGYRVYLYHNTPCRLTEGHILPQYEATLEKYSIFGFRSKVAGSSEYISRISTPTFMFARKIAKPQIPKQPKGALYATRPDYFGRSTYTFTTEYTHKPFSVMVLRSNDDILLSSLYKQTPYGQTPIANSVQDIRIQNNDDFSNDRLLDLANAQTDSNHLFPEHNGYRFPIPNNESFYEGINAFITDHNTHYGDTVPHITPASINDMGHVVIPGVPGRNDELSFYDFVQQAIINTYVSLTEIPIIYQYIKDGNYSPIAKAQVIRDRNGSLCNRSIPNLILLP